MQGIIDGIIAPEGAQMLPYNLTVLPAFNPLGVGSDFYRASDGTGINRVAVLVKPYEACL